MNLIIITNYGSLINHRNCFNTENASTNTTRRYDLFGLFFGLEVRIGSFHHFQARFGHKIGFLMNIETLVEIFPKQRFRDFSKIFPDCFPFDMIRLHTNSFQLYTNFFHLYTNFLRFRTYFAGFAVSEYLLWIFWNKLIVICIYLLLPLKQATDFVSISILHRHFHSILSFSSLLVGNCIILLMALK